MICPNCTKPMSDLPLDSRLGAPITIDVCTPCQAFWFDHHESIQLSPGSTLKLMKHIGEHSSTVKPAWSSNFPCPRCGQSLSLSHDLVRSMRFAYWGCPAGDGRFLSFFDFLISKNFIHALTPQEIQQLKQNVQAINCSNCGASIDLKTNSACPYCHSAISMLDLKQQQQMLEQLRQAAEPRAIDPTLPLKLAQAKSQVEALFEKDHSSSWQDNRSNDLVQAGLQLVATWLLS